MLVLALLLIVLSVGATAVVLARASEPVTISMFGWDASTTAREVFVAGIVAGLVFALALWLMSHSAKRTHRKRRQRSEAERARRTEVERLEAEKAALESRLRASRSAGPDSGATRQDATRENQDPEIDLRDGQRVGSSPLSRFTKDRADGRR
jgi:hypothetical protein